MSKLLKTLDQISRIQKKIIVFLRVKIYSSKSDAKNGKAFALCQVVNQRKPGFVCVCFFVLFWFWFLFTSKKCCILYLVIFLHQKISVEPFGIYCYPLEADSHSFVYGVCAQFSKIFLI